MNETMRAGEAQLPRPGDVVAGKYRVESVIGAGGMGVVLGAVDTSLGRPVAIKFLAPAKAKREGAVARFLREARAAAALQSEHVVRVFEVGTAPNGAPFIVMELLRGQDLAQVLTSRGPLPEQDAIDYVLQACEALGEAHTRGIVHRDLKPQNLFLTQQPDGSPCLKVVDFGISKAIDDTDQHLTSTDMVMGTPLYMSPEQVRSLKNVDARSDIWALGSILFELLTAMPIFEAPSASALCAMIAMDPPIPLRARRPTSHPDLEAVILRCLHKDPAGRFQDVAHLASALAPFASERGRLSATRVSRIVRSASGGNPLGGYPEAGPTGAVGASSLPSNPPLGFGSLGSPGGPTPMQGSSAFASNPTIDGHGRTSFAPAGPSNAPVGFASNPPPNYASHPPQGALAPSMPPFPHAQQPPHVAVPSVPNALPLVRGGPTQNTWGHTNTGDLAPPKKGNAVLVAGLGVLTGLVLLGALVGGGYFFFVLRPAHTAAQVATDAGSPGATVAATTAAPTAAPPTPTASNATPVADAGPSPSPTNSGKTKPTDPRDAGAPTPKDGGAPTPPNPTPPAPTPTQDDRNAALARSAQTRCDNHTREMQVFARDESSRREAARRAKTFMCRGASSTRCERQVCINACSVLNDSPCLQQMNYIMSNGPAAPY